MSSVAQHPIEGSTPVVADCIPARSRARAWPPGPVTILATMAVGASLFWILIGNPELARGFFARYGWPFSGYFSGPITAAADAVIAVSILASTWMITQTGIILLGRSTNLRFLRHLVGLVTACALLLALYRLRSEFFTELFILSYNYGFASFLMLVSCRLLRIELPGRDRPR